MAMSGVHVVLALKLAPAEFLLVSPVVGVVTIVALLVWTGRYLAARRRPVQTPARVNMLNGEQTSIGASRETSRRFEPSSTRSRGEDQ